MKSMRVVIWAISMLVTSSIVAREYPFRTIQSSGSYKLAANVNNQITISANNVTLDMCGHTVSGDTYGVLVNGSLNNITIKNGSIVGADSDGIFVGSGCSDITIEDMTVKNAIRGIAFENVLGGAITNCEMSSNTTGLELHNTHKIAINNSVASINTNAGFSLLSSTTNCFTDCKALSTGQGNESLDSTTIFGFISQNGYGNIFERCIANSTQGLTVTGDNATVAGFALRGSESGTKIIDSEASGSTTNSQGVTTPYGIFLEATASSLTTVTNAFNSSVQAIAWSSDGKYLFMGGVFSPSQDEVVAVQYDSSVPSFTKIANLQLRNAQFSPNGSIYSMSLDVTRRYLVVVGKDLLAISNSESYTVVLIKFDPDRGILKVLQSFLLGPTPEISKDVQWTSDGQYFVVSSDPINGADKTITVFQFDPVTETATQVAQQILAGSSVFSIFWSADNNYIIVPQNSTIQLYRFDRVDNTLTLASSSSNSSGVLLDGSYSSDEKYFAIASSTGLRILEFDAETQQFNFVSSFFGGTAVSSVDWSSDGKFLVATASFAGNNVHLLRFDRGTQTLILLNSSSEIAASARVRFAPDGSVIASGDGSGDKLLTGLNFPQKNIIKNNTVYSNSGNKYPGGFGLSGSSVKNLIIENTSYNNALNYAFVQNIYNQILSTAPTNVQNISLEGCKAICQPTDLNLLLNQIQNQVCNGLESQLEVIISKIDGITNQCNATGITGPITITQPGHYCCANDINGSIIIAASDVALDINNHKITNGIVISGTRNQILIENGVVEAGSVDNAIAIASGATNIGIKNVAVKSGVVGMNFLNVAGGSIENCEMTLNTTGLLFDSCRDITIKNCIASCNTHAGFDLISSTTNCFEDCKALSTGEGNSDIAHVGIYGFVSQNGYGNIFERCIANSTQGLTVTGFDSMIAGFALRRSEQHTKIIECEAANSISSSVGVTVPYGILLEGTVDSTQVVTAGLGTTGDVNELVWSPDGKYVAIATTNVTGGTGQDFQIHTFNTSQNSLTPLVGMFTSTLVQTVDWDQSGQYIVVGGSNLGSQGSKFQIFSFNQTSQPITSITGVSAGSAQVNVVRFSPDSNFVAVGYGSGSTNSVEVYRFNRASQSVSLIATSLGASHQINDISWSPDGEYLGVVGRITGTGTGDALQILSFDSGLSLLQTVTGILSVAVEDTISAVSWSPNGKYIAVGGGNLGGGTQDNLQVMLFEEEVGHIVPLGGFFGHSGVVNTVSWSSDSRYLAVGGSGLPGSNEYQLFTFDPGTNAVIKKAAYLGTAGDVFTISFAPDGSTIAVGGSGLTGGANQELQVLTGLTFPMKNVITKNTVYCNSGNECPGGFGISGSSIKNMIIGNTSYNNPQNYAFVQNVFNQLFGQAPTDLQNISVGGCQAICQPDDLSQIIKQALYNACEVIPSEIDSIFETATQILIKACDLESQLEVVESKIALFQSGSPCEPTPIFTPQTIGVSGYYCVANEINGALVVNASDVTIDLHHHCILGGIVINSNLDDITIKNGCVEGSAVLDAISVASGCTNITFEDVVAKNGLRGINLQNVAGGLIENCELVMNTTGLGCTNSRKIVVKDTVALCNTRAGFDLLSSTTVCFEDCKALSTGEGNSSIANVGIYGFVSQNGYGNIFERCIANSTQGLTVTGFNSVIAGFALRGSEHCTKIIECESANSTSKSNGTTIPYGILLENSISTITTITGMITGTSAATFVKSVSWNTNGDFIAIGGSSGPSGNNQLKLFKFDREDGNLTLVDQFGTVVRSVQWSHDGDYLAIGGGGAFLQVFEFDCQQEQLSFVDSVDSNVGVNQVSWSYDDQYIAVASDDSLQIFSFDKVSQQLKLEARTIVTVVGAVSATSWSPDGAYVAIAGDQLTANNFQIFKFDRATKNVRFVAGAFTHPLVSVAWSFNGKYIAVGGDNSIGNTVQVFEFNEANESISFVAGALSSAVQVNSCAWSSDDKYLLVCGISGNGFVQLLSFDYGAQALTTKVSYITGGGACNSSEFSPDGKYIISGSGGGVTSGSKFRVLTGFSFPEKNIVKSNIVYGDSGAQIPSGIGISGSSIQNLIIGNTSYNNPLNYAYVTNVFNELFGSTPSDLQNIAVKGCAAICQPDDTEALLMTAKMKSGAVLGTEIDTITESFVEILQKTCDLDSLLDIIESKIGLISSNSPCNPTPISIAGTISSSGSYCLGNDITGSITIAASNVSLDLNNYKITSGLTINTNLDQIYVGNGCVEGSAVLDAISVASGCTNITFEDVVAKNGVRGINLQSVSGGLIENCELVMNTTGLGCTNSRKIVVKDTVALCNTRAGFDLLSSTTVCFEDCKALSTGEGNSSIANVGIYGFVSQNGYGNIFERCIANSTQGLTVTGFDSVIAGFALRGSEHCTKIIECESANSTSKSNGATIPYGILLENSISTITTITGMITGTPPATFVKSVSWNTNGDFIAIGGSSGPSGNNQLKLFKFDREDGNLTLVDQFGTVVRSVQWSHDGDYLAIGGGGAFLQVFEFDCQQEQLSFVDSVDSNVGVNQVSWSYDDQYIAVASDDSLQIFSFDKVSQQLKLEARTIVTVVGAVSATSWSPDGAYVAIAGDQLTANNFQIFKFDRATKNVRFVAGAFTHPLVSVAWSFNGKYIAVGGDNSIGNTVQVFEFNEANESISFVAGALSSAVQVNSCAWSSDDKYLLVCGISGNGFVQLLSFDYGAQALTTKVSYITGGGACNSSEFSPDGKYIISGSGGGVTSGSKFRVLTGFSFPEKNIVKSNIVYGDSGAQIPSGIGISGSSIQNLIIGNTSYNNPLNYAYVTNVFNELFGSAPSDLQNIAVKGCAAICQPDDVSFLIKQNLEKVCGPIQSQLDRIESKLVDLDTSSPCSPTPLTASNIVSGTITLNVPGNYCLNEDVTTDIVISTTCVHLDLNDRCVTGQILIKTSEQVLLENGFVTPLAPTSALVDPSITVTDSSVGTIISNVTIRNRDTVTTNIAGRIGIAIFGKQTQILNSTIRAGAAGNSSTTNAPYGGDGIFIGKGADDTLIQNVMVVSGNGGNTTNAGSSGGFGGDGVRITENRRVKILDTIIVETGDGGNATTGVGGDGGNGIQIDANTIDATVRNCTIQQTGIAGSGGTSGSGGKAVDDNVSTVDNLSMIFGNFAHNIANSIKFDLQNSGLEEGILTPNPPQSVVINPLANVYAS